MNWGVRYVEREELEREQEEEKRKRKERMREREEECASYEDLREVKPDEQEIERED